MPSSSPYVVGTTANMALVQPNPSVAPGPGWASTLNDDLALIDAHDHSPGKGVLVTPAGLDINTDLDCDSNGLTAVGRINLGTQASPVAMDLYSDGTDLFFKDKNGVAIRLTQGGALAVTAARGIGGDYSTDVASPLLTYTTASKEYKATTNGSAAADLRGGALKAGVSLLAANYTFTDTDGVQFLLLDTTAARTITLPVPSSASAGRSFVIIDRTGNAAAHNVTVQRQTSGLISGFTAQTLSTSYGALRIVGDGTNWSLW